MGKKISFAEQFKAKQGETFNEAKAGADRVTKPIKKDLEKATTGPQRPDDLYQWRNVIASPQGPKEPLTRYVLLTISLHMNNNCENCFPSVRHICERTGLSKPSVLAHIEKAIKAGWLERFLHNPKGKGWKRSEYKPLIPFKVVKQFDHDNSNGGKARLPRQADGGKPDLPRYTPSKSDFENTKATIKKKSTG